MTAVIDTTEGTVLYEAIPPEGPAQWEVWNTRMAWITDPVSKARAFKNGDFPGRVRFSYTSNWPSGINYGRRVAVIALIKLRVVDSKGALWALPFNSARTSFSGAYTGANYPQGVLIASASDSSRYAVVQARYANGNSMAILDGTLNEGWPGSISVVTTQNQAFGALYAALITAETSSFALDISW